MTKQRPANFKQRPVAYIIQNEANKLYLSRSLFEVDAWDKRAKYAAHFPSLAAASRWAEDHPRLTRLRFIPLWA